MIKLSEQYGYPNGKEYEEISDFLDKLENRSHKKSIQRSENGAFCYRIQYSQDSAKYLFETSYFVGVDWIVEKKLSIFIKPKIDDEQHETDYIGMLFEILKQQENYQHLDQLCEINFEKPTIEIEQKQDLLTPLLLVQFLNVLKRIVQKGLRKSYYPVEKNLNGRIKGRIMVNETIRKNHFNQKNLHNYCRFTEFGVNSPENKLLKKAFIFSVAALQNLKGLDVSKLSGLIHYIQPAFSQVEEELNIDTLKHSFTNQFYKEYEQALKFARHILKRYGYNISSTSSTKIKTPPFWIDMSKLFELYVFSKLKERFPRPNEVTYHKLFRSQEPDFIVNSLDNQCKMIVDAKYKPKYQNNSINIEDVRQVSGYARLNSVYDFLKLERDKIIDCLIIYSDNEASESLTEVDLKMKEETGYNRLYKIGIKLPRSHLKNEFV